MITLEYINQLKHIRDQADGDGQGAMLDMLQALVPALPPMVGAVVTEFVQHISEPNPHLNTGAIPDDV